MGLDFFANSGQHTLQNRNSLKCLLGQCTIFCGQLLYRLETRGLKVRTEVVYGKALDHRSLSYFYGNLGQR